MQTILLSIIIIIIIIISLIESCTLQAKALESDFDERQRVQVIACRFFSHWYSTNDASSAVDDSTVPWVRIPLTIPTT